MLRRIEQEDIESIEVLAIGHTYVEFTDGRGECSCDNIKDNYVEKD